MSSSTIIADCSVELHNPNIVRDVNVPGLMIGERFGLLTIDFEKAEMTNTPTFILFNIDRTGSMSEPGNIGDTYNKMHYVKETFKQIAQYISRKDAEIYIKVLAFHTEVETLVDCVKISPENCDKIVQKIMSVEPNGSTAIDAALLSASVILKKYKQENEGHDVYHIFMTDGEPTTGIVSHSDLASMVDKDFSTVFVGFGKNHNSSLLQKMSEGPLSNYEVIDNIEHTGVVYASIMHEILFTSVRNFRLTVEKGEIYDWTTNMWTNSLQEASIVSESKKIYYLKTVDREKLAVRMFGKINGSVEETHLDDAFVLPDLEDMETGEIQHSCDEDLSKHIYRISTQEILFKSKTMVRVGLAQFKQSVSLLFRKMRRFMRLNDLSADPMMAQLCDDLSIVYRTAGTRHGQMFSVARSSSQGRQNSNTATMTQEPDHDYNDTFVPAYDSQVPMLPRSNAMQLMRCNSAGPTPLMHPVDEEDDFEPIFQEIEGDFDDNDYIDHYLPSENPISCFATPTALNTIRSLTQGNQGHQNQRR